jgi:hypothetical protein
MTDPVRRTPRRLLTETLVTRRPHTTTLIAPLAALALMAQAGHASIINPSFEDTTAHQLTGEIRVPTGWTIDTYFNGYPLSGATEGWPFATQPTHGQSMGIARDGRLTQSVFLQAGDEVLVDVAIETDRSGSGGEALFELVSPETFLSRQINVSISWFGRGYGISRIDWQTLSLVVPTTGTYELRLQGFFDGTADGGTSAFFDNIRVVPSPGAAATLGFAGVLAAGVRRR